MNKYEKFHKKNCNSNYKVEDVLNIMKARDQAISLFSWAVPNDEAIEICVKYEPLVEIGAGKGYWASLIKEAGGQIDAYDKEPFELVKYGLPDNICQHTEANLFLCWPPYDEPMAYECLNQFKNRYVIYVGEDCTGCEKFHELLPKQFNGIERVNIPQWYGLHDCLTIWERK